MRILCVEDGSVDIDALENGELRDGKVLVYRQESKPPFILEIPDKGGIWFKRWQKLREYVETELKGDTELYEVDKDDYFDGCVNTDEDILSKMQELEKFDDLN